MSHTSKIVASSIVAFISLLSIVSAQVPSIAPPQATPPAGAAEVAAKTPETPAKAHALIREDVEAWLDGFMPYALQRGDVAGAVVVVVKDGQVLVPKGYGYSDVKARKPVDPEKTLFRAGSVSKLYTWTAVMQLVEQGKLDLDTDVNTYLDFKIPAREGKPVTLRNIMTHTPGFDEVIRALITPNAKDLLPLHDALARWVPPRVTAPGSTPAYSNYGAALAGYIVERVSGESFDDYIEKHIFAPLGMKFASFRQPLPSQLEPFMSKGYKVGSEDPKPFEIVTIAPAGSLACSGTDMARFAIAHLQNGTFESNHILQEATAKTMHGTPNNILPPLHSMLLGFYQNDVNGHRVATHAGDTEWFHSELNLFIDDNVAMYISLNSLGKEGAAGPIREMLLKEFGDRYFPAPLPEGSVDAKTAKEHAQLMTGRYTVSRRPHTSFLSMLNLLGQAKVAVNSDGTLTFDALKGPNGQPEKFTEIAPFVWRNVDGGDRIAAKVENGRVVRIGYDAYPFMVFEPVPFSWSAGWLMPLWIGALVALGLTVLAWPTSVFVRRHYGATYGLTGADARMHRIVRLTCLFVLGLMLLWIFTIAMMIKDFAWVAPSMDGWVITLRLLSDVIFIVGAVVALWCAWVVLRSGRRKLAKLWSVILAASCLLMLYMAFVFHFIGFGANY